MSSSAQITSVGTCDVTAAGANSIFHGEKLLTTGNPEVERDRTLLQRLGLTVT